MDYGTITTTNHEEIKKWIELHGGKPAIIRDKATSEPVGLRVDFPGPEDESLLSDVKENKDVNWETFFSLMDEKNLAFQYETNPKNDDITLTFHFIHRE